MSRKAAAVMVLALFASGCIDVLGAPSGPTLPQALLWRSVSSSIIVEVDAAPGMAPDLAALELLRTTLAQVTGKTVAVTGPTAMPGQGDRYDVQDLLRIHRETAFFGGEGFVDGGRAVIHVLYLDGRSGGDDADHRTLGRTLVEHGVVAIFRTSYSSAHRILNDTWVDATAEMDQHVLLHEVGHALGLVGNGIPQVRDHADPGSPGHSRYPESVLYHHPPMTPKQLVTGAVSTTFDVDDLADLAAFRAADPSKPGLAGP
ncbi:MAG: zinc metalloprotease [Thermoplasmatota archaeon]